MGEPTDRAGLRERIAAVLRTTTSALMSGYPTIHPGVHGETHTFHAACALCHGEADTLTAAVLPLVEQAVAEQTAQLRVERHRFRAAWLNARNRAQELAERYRYQRKLRRDADIRASKAIRAQLAAEADRDRLAAEVAQLRARVRTLEHVAAGNKRYVQLIVPDLEAAQAAIDRARAECDAMDAEQNGSEDDGMRTAIERIRTALDTPQETA